MQSGNPWDSKPEGFCVTCDGFTTNYDNGGECSDCKTELMFENVDSFLKSKGIDKGLLIAAMSTIDSEQERLRIMGVVDILEPK